MQMVSDQMLQRERPLKDQTPCSGTNTMLVHELIFCAELSKMVLVLNEL